MEEEYKQEVIVDCDQTFPKQIAGTYVHRHITVAVALWMDVQYHVDCLRLLRAIVYDQKLKTQRDRIYKARELMRQAREYRKQTQPTIEHNRNLKCQITITKAQIEEQKRLLAEARDRVKKKKETLRVLKLANKGYEESRVKQKARVAHRQQVLAEVTDICDSVTDENRKESAQKIVTLLKSCDCSKIL